MHYSYCEEGMQKLHREMQCTCCQLALVSKWLAAPLHHIGTLQVAGLPVDQHDH